MNGNKGFTLVELIIVIGIVGILAAFSVPSFIDWSRNASYKEAANLSLTALRQAKGQAINLNQSVTVLFTLDDSAANTANKIKIGTGSEVLFKKGLEIKQGEACDVANGTLSINFNPTGTSDAGYICIFDGTLQKYRVGIATPNTGRILLQRWQGGAWK
jgi:prepilin-type N-terminal cleavage/methylation domain-containing protein